jgi:hypothetical protein
MLIRFTHGDAIRGTGGQSGITLPINKAIDRGWDKERQADYTVLGHFHQLHFAPRCMVNGSVVGYNAYARYIKAGYEPPRQGMFLAVQGRKEPTCYNTIWLDS